MKKKILITQNTFTNYQFDFYEILKKYYSVKIYFLNRKYNNYNFFYNKNNNDFFFEKHIPLKKLIKKEKPDLLFFGGINHLKLISTYNDLKKINIKYFFWLERVSDNFVKRKYYELFYKKILSQASGILAIGKEAEAFYKKFNKKTFNLQYCINVSKYNTEKLVLKNKINFLYIGQFIKRKGLEEVVAALNLLNESERSQIKFTFIGEGPFKKNLLKTQKYQKNIKVVKFKNRSLLMQYFKRNNVFLFPSLYDGWGVAPMEAMISGLYLIISNQCGFIRSNISFKKFNRVISPTKDEILKSIRFCIKNKNKITTNGKKNHYIIKKSLLNAKLNVKRLNLFLDKL